MEKKCKNCNYWYFMEGRTIRPCHKLDVFMGMPEDPVDYEKMRKLDCDHTILRGFNHDTTRPFTGADFGCIHFEERSNNDT